MKKTPKSIIALIIINCFLNPFNLVQGEIYEERPMIYGTTSLIVDIDPHYAWDSASTNHIDQVMEGLFSYNLKDPNMAIQPQLAVDFGTWEEGKEGLYGTLWNYTVELKTGIKFHDGTTFGPEDVVWSFNRLNHFVANETPTQIAELYKPLESLYPETPLLINTTIALNATHVRFVCNYIYAALEALLCFSGSVIMPEDKYPTHEYIDTATDVLIGTGPYQQVSNTDRLTVFAYWEDYYGGYGIESPSIQEMQWVLYDDATTLNQAFLDGDIDAIGGISMSFMDEYEESEYHDFSERMSGTVIIYAGFNCEQIDLHTRRAMQDAINYTHVIDDLGKGELIQMTSIVPKGIKYHDQSLLAPTMNITAARNHMIDAVEAGEQGLEKPSNWSILKNSTKDEDWQAVTIVTYKYMYSSSATMREGVGELFKINFANIGINLKLFGLTWGEFLNSLYDGTCQVFRLGMGPDFNDPNNFIDPLMFSNSTANHAHINDSILDNYIISGLNETNSSKREDIYKEMQQYIVDLAPMAYLYTSNARSVYFMGCKNTARNPMGKLYFYLWDFDYSKIKANLFSFSYVLYFIGSVGIVIGAIMLLKSQKGWREKQREKRLQRKVQLFFAEKNEVNQFIEDLDENFSQWDKNKKIKL
ncbi:ABC transporter substrate-binding protein [Candidatus Lokiarchaeum ossiferum]|uniref:ABC transporter substrate-binding protein n=1 Tax=Candidatus Lokiarchaeum ossiferum TaxID=2951803 RepID=UPI00352EE81E